jgi:hypothetical protein
MCQARSELQRVVYFSRVAYEASNQFALRHSSSHEVYGFPKLWDELTLGGDASSK